MPRGKREVLQAGSRLAQNVAPSGFRARGELRVRPQVAARTAKPTQASTCIVLRGQPDPEAVHVLRAALGLLRNKGWQPHWLSETERHAAIRAGNQRARALSVVSAIQLAGNGSVASYHARQILQKLVGPIPSWEQHPLRIWREVEQLLLRAIELETGQTQPRGNWRVSSGPWKGGGEG